MIHQTSGFKRTFRNATGRWAAVGPYYAMFPLEFAFQIVSEFSKPGQVVLDPFAGRASSIYAAATQGRYGFGIEVNPVGWVYAQAKLNPARMHFVEKRLKVLSKDASELQNNIKELPPFFHACYSKNVLCFLMSARKNLNWQKNRTDRTLMAFILVYLHGKRGQTLSNQMNHTKSMGPGYSLKWWKNKGLDPPSIQCFDFLSQRIRWRYKKGTPPVTTSNVILGDSAEILKKSYRNFTNKKVSLFFTSPPYKGVTNYHKDQWLRLWLLGGSETPLGVSQKHKGRFESREEYRSLLDHVFETSSQLMAKRCTIYVRTSSRKFTYDTTLEILEKHFPKAKQNIIDSPIKGKTQTTLMGNKSIMPGEVDIKLTL
ncbi:MAG: site-specific DNA-methyltransferase [Chloroflexi bacterium]|nr:site-specific DNA-methyltransferase [Chloroflexota bacterium]